MELRVCMAPDVSLQLLRKVAECYVGATETRRSLLKWWFQTPQLLRLLGCMATHFRFQHLARHSEAFSFN